MTSLNSVRILPSALAERIERRARIVRTTIKKRRRGWTLRYEEVRVPCALVVGNTIYVHPDAYAKLRASGEVGL